MDSTIQIFEFNSELLTLAWEFLEQLDDAAPSALVAHLLASRRVALDLAGQPDSNLASGGREPGLEGGVPASHGDNNSPGLAELGEAWEASMGMLAERLGRMTSEDAAAPAARHFPMGGGTVGEALMFLAWHETYHIGQIGSWIDTSPRSERMRDLIYRVRGPGDDSLP